MLGIASRTEAADDGDGDAGEHAAGILRLFVFVVVVVFGLGDLGPRLRPFFAFVVVVVVSFGLLLAPLRGYLGLSGAIRSLCLRVATVPSGRFVRIVVVRRRTPVSSSYRSSTSLVTPGSLVVALFGFGCGFDFDFDSLGQPPLFAGLLLSILFLLLLAAASFGRLLHFLRSVARRGDFGGGRLVFFFCTCFASFFFPQLVLPLGLRFFCLLLLLLAREIGEIGFDGGGRHSQFVKSSRRLSVGGRSCRQRMSLASSSAEAKKLLPLLLLFPAAPAAPQLAKDDLLDDFPAKHTGE